MNHDVVRVKKQRRDSRALTNNSKKNRESKLDPNWRSPNQIHLDFRPRWQDHSIDFETKDAVIAWIAIESVLSDVTSALARRRKDQIFYRIEDDNGFEFGKRLTRNLSRPLTLRELADFFLSAWDIREVLETNFANEGYPLDKIRAFYRAGSNVYPEFESLIRLCVEEWLSRKRPPKGPNEHTSAKASCT